MLPGDFRDRRKTKKIGLSEYCTTDHEGFRSVCLNRWVLQTVASQMHQHYRENCGTNGPTHDFIVFTLLACGCMDFIKISTLSYLDTMLHGSQGTDKMVLGISGKEFQLSLCAVN